MAVIRDVMPAFELVQPNSIADVQKVLEQQGENGWVLAGGMDSFDWLKDRIKKPKVVVDLSGVAELKGIRTTADGIEIGAMTTLTEVVQHPVIREKYKLLADSAELVASPQIRNQGTIGGNVSQDARCWYYRAGWPCYRASGNICYADTPEGRNREHAILHAERCVAVNPSVSDMTWGMMYVLHGLAGVGLIALIMVHVYFGIRPEKRPITKSMIFGWMSRDFYIEEHDPARWPVEASAPLARSQGAKTEGLTDAG